MQMPLVLTNRRRRGGSASAPAFSPSTLYSSGSQGIWLDPSDLTTMFADRAGTTPVTTPGTVVGLRLDKSKGLVLGAELVTNGDFASGTDGWSKQPNVTWSVVGEVLNATASAGSSNGVYTSFSVVAGRTYRFSGSLANIASAVGYGIRIGASSFGYSGEYGVFLTWGGSAFFTPTATGTCFVWVGVNFSGLTTTFDNISVRELAGNHAVAPTDAARPIYGVEPKGGGRNLLERTEDATNAYWTKVGLPTAASSAGFSTLTENTSSSVHSLSRPSVTTPTAYTNFTLSASFKAGTRRYVQLQFDNGSQAVGVVIDTQLWSATPITGAGMVTSYSVVEEDASTYRVKVSGIYTSGTFVANAVVYGLSSATQNSVTYTGNGSTIIVGKLQLELGSTATAYQRVTTAYDVTESGVATTHYVQYDGSDDSMSTSAIDFTATDKMSVFAGVRKLSDAATGVVMEFGGGADNGGFLVHAPNTLFALQYRWFFQNNAGIGINLGPSTGYAAPINNVLTGIADISGDRSTIRLNGTQVAQSTADQGSGNFANLSLNIGRRNNATLPFNGRDFGIIVVGKAASAAEITDTELWLSDRTSEVDVAKSISPNIYTRSGDTILDRANSIIERRTV